MINHYMQMALDLASKSTAVKLQVGTIIVKDGVVLSDGRNGTPSGWNNICEHEGMSKPEVFHAEENAILKLAKGTGSGNGAELYCTHAPCMACAKLIYGAGIIRVYWKTEYRNTHGLDFLKQCNIETIKV